MCGKDRSQGEYLNVAKQKNHVEIFVQVGYPKNETSNMHQKRACHVIILLTNVGIVKIDVQCDGSVSMGKELPISPIYMIVESRP